MSASIAFQSYITYIAISGGSYEHRQTGIDSIDLVHLVMPIEHNRDFNTFYIAVIALTQIDYLIT